MTDSWPNLIPKRWVGHLSNPFQKGWTPIQVTIADLRSQTNLQNKNTWQTHWMIVFILPTSVAIKQPWTSPKTPFLPPWNCARAKITSCERSEIWDWKKRFDSVEIPSNGWFFRNLKELMDFRAPILGSRDPIPEKSIPTTHQAWSPIVAFEQVYCMPAYRSSSKAETPYFIPPYVSKGVGWRVEEWMTWMTLCFLVGSLVAWEHILYMLEITNYQISVWSTYLVNILPRSFT